MAANPVGRGPGFVDELQPPRIEIKLPLGSSPAPIANVEPVLLARVNRLFARDQMTGEEPPQHRDAGGDPVPRHVVRNSSSVLSDCCSMTAWMRAA